MLVPKRTRGAIPKHRTVTKAGRTLMPAGVFVHLTFNDANGIKKDLDSDVFASKDLAEAARTGMKLVLKALGAQNIRACIKEND